VKSNVAVFGIVAGTVLLYVTAIVAGLKVKDFSIDRDRIQMHKGMDWTPPLESSIPDNARGDSIRRGRLLFNETPLYASQNTSGKIACGSCHAEGGMQPFASPMVGLPAKFPMFNARAGHTISLEDRVQECFVRSENGKPLDYKSDTMKAFVDYINWLSQPEPHRAPFKGRGLVSLPDLKPDPVHGKQVYVAQCAGCHGGDGLGRVPMFPPVWGPDSFNDGAGMNNLQKMAAFVQHNMPQNRMGILTPQQAYDVSAYIQAQPRPAFNTAYKHF
jgi:thiosulfate dehydrogenase